MGRARARDVCRLVDGCGGKHPSAPALHGSVGIGRGVERAGTGGDAGESLSLHIDAPGQHWEGDEGERDAIQERPLHVRQNSRITRD